SGDLAVLNAGVLRPSGPRHQAGKEGGRRRIEPARHPGAGEGADESCPSLPEAVVDCGDPAILVRSDRRSARRLVGLAVDAPARAKAINRKSETLEQVRHELHGALPRAEEFVEAQVRLPRAGSPPVAKVRRTALAHQGTAGLDPGAELSRRLLGK